jgi:hypothetical protein
MMTTYSNCKKKGHPLVKKTSKNGAIKSDLLEQTRRTSDVAGDDNASEGDNDDKQQMLTATDTRRK